MFQEGKIIKKIITKSECPNFLTAFEIGNDFIMSFYYHFLTLTKLLLLRIQRWSQIYF
jgi:hypothetical protein